MLRLLLRPHALLWCRQRYRHGREWGASRSWSLLLTLLALLAWSLFPLERPGWQWLRRHRHALFPQLERPRSGDPLRALIQLCWLLVRRPEPIPLRWPEAWRRNWQRLTAELGRRLARFERKGVSAAVGGPRVARWKAGLFCTVAGLLSLLCITQPFDALAQLVFVVLLASMALVLRAIPGRYPMLMLMVLSLIISCRYIWWRYTSTLDWLDPVSLGCGLLLLFAETYAWVVLLLGYWQTAWPLHRPPAPLPLDQRLWPSVDLMIPTYNEDLAIVKGTVYGALALDWPRDKLTIWLLDDGDRPAFRDFAEEAGIRYVARPTHEHAKAGNINHALKQAQGELVAIFDCDHLPTRSFLQMTVGWFFKDPSLALVQTPHHFFSADPFERNLSRFRKMPNEGALFYGLIQDGNDTWDASFFCGSCAVIKRSALDRIGGIAVETVTEDAHTSLRLHRLGYTSAYIRIPQAAGLATESLSAHIGQRIRWARGMVQILRLDNPLFGKGLNLGQRLCYFNAMLHFMSGIPRLIFLTAPLAFLILHAYIIYAPAGAIALYMLPHIFHSALTNSRLQGKVRHSFWGEVYETVLAWYIARPTTVALFAPHKGKFNVTAKGGMTDEVYLDLEVSRPYLLLMLLNLCGLGFGIWRIATGLPGEIPTLILGMLWVLYNMTILGGALAVAFESRQVRANPRVEMAMPAAIRLASGHLYPCVLKDYSNGGVGLELDRELPLDGRETVWLLLRNGLRESLFAAQVRRVMGRKLGLALAPMTREQHIAFIQCTFARADTWSLWQERLGRDRPLHSLIDITRLGWSAYWRLLRGSVLAPFCIASEKLTRWLLSFLPRRVSPDFRSQAPTLETVKG
ncbi:UDP-forming cellulose synthase catalytic subunit [Aeromonas diversa]|uniref:UDP-forming cellulose synthase catalytic subunit n=1 Tax=Aeromonas diversa TaxID=502790 RepID=UPI0003A64162|nr:UDP-forming cellulose synthase catalytic subunit [Aeromonas diversa]